MREEFKIHPSHNMSSLIDGDSVCVNCHLCSCHAVTISDRCEKQNQESTPDGLYEKYEVKRLQPSHRGTDHSDCFYFVLDPEHDRAAFEALMTYVNAESTILYHPALARDLLFRLSLISAKRANEDSKEYVKGELKK